MARTELFRGYRAAPVAFSGVLAFGAALVQGAWLPNPEGQAPAYLALWLGAAVVSGVLSGVGMVMRRRRPAAGWERRKTWLAVEQFLPCLAAGGLLTLAVARSVPEAFPLLPGLWQILFSLGIFASCRQLPRATLGVAGFYLTTGLLCLVWARGAWRSPHWRWECPSASASCWPRASSTGIWNAAMSKFDHQGAGQGEPTGRFAYEGLERIIHEKARLGILTSLVTHPDGILFPDLKGLCALTDGNLSRHLQALHEAGLVEVWKGHKNNRPQTLCRLTDEGRRRFLDYINVLESVVADALTAKRTEPGTGPAKGWSPA